MFKHIKQICIKHVHVHKSVLRTIQTENYHMSASRKNGVRINYPAHVTIGIHTPPHPC